MPRSHEAAGRWARQPRPKACVPALHADVVFRSSESLIMAPRRRARTGQAAPISPSLTSLPDDLVLLCLEQLTQEER